MTEAYEPLRRIYESVEEIIDQKIWVATALVKEVDPLDRMIRISILPGNKDFGWVQVYWWNGGTDYQSGQLPDVDSEVVCLFPDGSHTGCFVLAGGFFTGTPESIDDEDSVLISDKRGNKIVLDSNGVTVTSAQDVNIIAAGSISLGEGASESLIKGNSFLTFFNTHKHIDPLTGVTGTVDPSSLMTAAQLSTKSKTV